MDELLDVPDSALAAEAPPEAESSARRALLRAFAAGAGFAALGSSARAASGSGTWPPQGELRFLVDRTTNGWTPAAWARARQLGYKGWLEEQLNWQAIPEDAALLTTLSSFTTLTMSSKAIYDTYFGPSATLPQSTPINQLKAATVLRGAYSTRQLYERMVEFWTDHFSVDHGNNQVRWLKTQEDRDVIRVHALGNFRTLLGADAKSAAMLDYLDNNVNFASSPNENYGRELLELHTMEVGNYTEADVLAVSRCFTGWQYRNTANANHGEFFYNSAQHDNGAKVVLGNNIASGGGMNDGETVLNILAAHPATANFVCRKLCNWLLCYNPPQNVVNYVAGVFLSTGGDIKSVVRAVFSTRVLRSLPLNTGLKLKRPFTLMTSLMRTLNPVITNPDRFTNELGTMGHRPMAWPTPNGYPDAAEDWASAPLPRWNFVQRFCSNSITNVSINIAAIFPVSVPKSQLAARANDVLTGGTLDPAHVAAVQAYADSVVTLNDTLRRDVLSLCAQIPSFQYH